MDPPWKGHIDSYAKSLIKTKVRVRPRNITELENINKINKSLLTVTSMRSIKSTGKSTIKADPKKDTSKIIKEEKEINVIPVDPHNKYE